MGWLRENSFWIVLAILFVWMHVKTQAAPAARRTGAGSQQVDRETGGNAQGPQLPDGPARG